MTNGSIPKPLDVAYVLINYNLIDLQPVEK